MLFQCDIKEHDGLPRGPVEAGSWLSAGSRLGVTILTFVVWSKKPPRPFYTHCSQTMEQSSVFVNAFMMDFFDRIPSLLQHNALRGCCDARRQFRSSRFRAWILVSALETYPFKEMSVCFFPDGHGNGAVDGHFWMQTLLGELRCWHEGHQQHRCLHERPQRDGDGRAKNTTQLQRSRKASTSRRSRSRTSRRRSSTRSLCAQSEHGKQSEQRLVLQVRWQGSSGMLPWCTTTVLLAERHRNIGGHQSTPDDDAVADMSRQCRHYYRHSTPEQLSLDLDTQLKNWKLMHKLRLSAPRFRTLGERLKRCRAWRQTLESTSLTRRNAHGIPCRTTARRR